MKPTAVLHPRGSEYDVQFVVDGPAFDAEIARRRLRLRLMRAMLSPCVY